jgi:hypothetical protein
LYEAEGTSLLYFPNPENKRALKQKIFDSKRAFPGTATWNLTKEITKINHLLSNIIQNNRGCLLLASSDSESYRCTTKDLYFQELQD